MVKKKTLEVMIQWVMVTGEFHVTISTIIPYIELSKKLILAFPWENPNEHLGQPNINSLKAFHGVRCMSEVNEKWKDMDLPSTFCLCFFKKQNQKCCVCVVLFLVKFFNIKKQLIIVDLQYCIHRAWYWVSTNHP